jgi:DNA-binding NarL/FixJ family response regulator
MLSGRSERELILECFSAGASGYISKDLGNDGLFRRALDMVFQGSIFLPTSVFYPVHTRTRKSLGEMMRTLSVT